MWKGRVGRHLVIPWDYQLPQCHPGSYWCQYSVNRDQIHFASQREPNQYRCYSLLAKDSPAPIQTLSKSLHADLWADLCYPPRRDWCEDVINALWDSYPKVEEEIDAAVQREDPTCQAIADEFIFLGPFDWLHREVACVDYCHSVLGIPRHPVIYQALEALLRFGSLVFTFEQLCIICDRPAMIEPQVIFSDGARFCRRGETGNN